MKTSRFRYSYRKSASSLHRKVGEALRDSDIFKHQQIYQEYPVNKVAKDYAFGSHHFDWVIPGLRVVIEVHGEQHYYPVAFGGDQQEAEEAFKKTQIRDRQKQVAALNAGWTYVVIPYTDKGKITDAFLYNLIVAEDKETGYTDEEVERDELHDFKQERFADSARIQKERRKKYLESTTHKRRLDEARKYRRDRYRKLKEQNDR